MTCAAEGCRYKPNAAGRYCDRHDFDAGLPGWSRTRDEAWLAYKSTDEVNAIPVAGNEKREGRK